MHDNHTQCRMRKVNPPIHSFGDPYLSFYVAWIPSKFAEIGRILDIKNEKDEWDTGWEVIEVHTELPTAVVREREQDYKKTRRASDI